MRLARFHFDSRCHWLINLLTTHAPSDDISSAKWHNGALVVMFPVVFPSFFCQRLSLSKIDDLLRRPEFVLYLNNKGDGYVWPSAADEMAFVAAGSSSSDAEPLVTTVLVRCCNSPPLLLPPPAITGARQIDASTLSGCGMQSVGSVAGRVDFCSPVNCFISRYILASTSLLLPLGMDQIKWNGTLPWKQIALLYWFEMWYFFWGGHILSTPIMSLQLWAPFVLQSRVTSLDWKNLASGRNALHEYSKGDLP